MGAVLQAGQSTSLDVQRADLPKPKTTRQEIESAAQQFEGLLIHQLLKSSSDEGGGWMGTGEEDTAGLQAMELAQEQFAAAMSARGGLGLAKMVIPQLMADEKRFTAEVK